jgi:steroid 5-alpha reductase family enzyme
VLIIAIAGEGLSDAQLRRYRAGAAHGAICDRGFWKFSRHPNYFFEWLGWCAYPLFALSGGHWIGALALTGPTMMYILLVHISGIPPLEQHMERSRGAAWRLYVARTRPFLPLP